MHHLQVGLEPQGSERIRIAGSWDIAARIVAMDPSSRVFEHPADSLEVGRKGLRIEIDRNGPIIVHQSPGGTATPFVGPQWREVAVAPEGYRDLVKALALHCRLDPNKTPSGRAWPVTYRVIARVLANRIFDSALWDCRLQLDESGFSHGNPPTRFAPPSPEANGITVTEFWALYRDDAPVAYLWNGWAWNQVGERLNLAARFSRGDAIDALARELLNRSGLKSSTTLPPVGSRWTPTMGAAPTMFT